MIKASLSPRTVIAAMLASVVAAGCAQQSEAPAATAPAAAEDAEAAKSTAEAEAPRRGISLETHRYAAGSTHFDRIGPRTELISDNRALDVAVGERAVGAVGPGGSWTLVTAGAFEAGSPAVQQQDVVVVSIAADKAGGKPALAIDNRLSRTLYVPPIAIIEDGLRISAMAGKGCNLPAGANIDLRLPETSLSFVLANVEKTMEAPVCGPDHVFFPETSL